MIPLFYWALVFEHNHLDESFSECARPRIEGVTIDHVKYHGMMRYFSTVDEEGLFQCK